MCVAAEMFTQPRGDCCFALIAVSQISSRNRFH
jgi:hypothetical protein